MSAPGFLSINTLGLGQVLMANVPFAFAATVPVTLQPRSGSVALGSRCTVGTSVTVEYFDPAQPVGRPPVSTQSAPIAHGPAPWTFDLRVFNASPGARGFYARLTLNCADAAGTPLSITGQRMVVAEVSNDPSVGFFVHPGDASTSVGQGASFAVRVGGGPTPSSDRDQYRLFWEQSHDGSATWRMVATSYQLDAPAAAAAEGRAHALALSGLLAADNGSLIRARACYAPPGQIERCVLSRSARLAVTQALVPPTITRQPRSQSTRIGETASFDVGFAGTPAPTVRWQRLDADAVTWLDIGTPPAWPATPGQAATLVTPVGALADHGTLLRAVVDNAGGQVASDAVVWRVSDALVATTITSQPMDARAAIGGTAVFAAAADGTAPLSYQWTRDGSPLAGATSPVLAIAQVQTQDLGSYRLVVSGPGGTATSQAATLTEVAGPPASVVPTLTTQPLPATVPVGTSATFAVAVAGTPAPSCRWTRNGIPIALATSCASYTTPPGTVADNGAVYNVVVSNSAGTVIGGGALLTVTGATPAVWTPLDTRSGAYLYDVTLVGGDPMRVVAVGVNAAMLRSTDGGASWTKLALPMDDTDHLFKVRFRDAQVGIAVAGRHILRSVDGGATWQAVWRAVDVEPGLGFVSQELRSFDWLDADTLVAVGAGGTSVWRSVDAGLTWAVHGTAANLNVHRVAFAGPTVALAAQHQRVMRTTDGGLTWTEIAAGTFVDSELNVAHLGGSIWMVAGGRGTYRSIDDGASWTRTDWPGLFLLGIRSHGQRVRVVGDDGSLLRSDNAGGTWSSQPNVGFGQLWSVDFGAPGTSAFAVGTGGLVARQAPH